MKVHVKKFYDGISLKVIHYLGLLKDVTKNIGCASMAKYFIAIFISFLIGYLGYDYGVNKTKSYYVQLQKESLSKLNNQLVLLQEQNQELNKRIVLNSLEKEREIYNINKRHSSIISSLQQRPERTNSITEQNPSVTTANSPRVS